MVFFVFFFSSRRRHTRCALVTGVQTCALPIFADGHHEIQLSPYVGHRQDTGAVDKAADAFRRAAAGEFAPLPDGQSEFGFQTGAYWFHATVRNEKDRKRVE